MKSLFRLSAMAILALSLTIFIGCSSDNDNTPTGPTTTDLFSDMAQIGDNYLTAGTKNITADALWADIQNDENLFIISLRSAGVYDTCGHIEGAVRWDLSSVPDHIDEIPDGAKVICYCYTGQTASFTTCYLNMMGFDAYNLLWGMCGWTSDTTVTLNLWGKLVPGGQETETTAHTATTEYEFPTIEGTSAQDELNTRCTAMFTAGLSTYMITAADVYLNLNDGDTSNDPFIINYGWPQASYDAGHVPGSILFGGGTLGPTENLKYLPTDKQIVVWCFTGQTSAQVCMYLGMLGYDVYSLRYGMNSIDPSLCGTHVYSTPTTDYPVVYGPPA